MLHLQSESTQRWLLHVDQHLDQLLIDHAHCERLDQLSKMEADIIATGSELPRMHS